MIFLLLHNTKEDIMNNASAAFVHSLKVKGVEIFQAPKRSVKLQTPILSVYSLSNQIKSLII